MNDKLYPLTLEKINAVYKKVSFGTKTPDCMILSPAAFLMVRGWKRCGSWYRKDNLCVRRIKALKLEGI